MIDTKRILKRAGVKLHKKGYNNSPIDGVPQAIGLNAATDFLMSRDLTSLARFALLPLSIIPGLLPLAFMSANFSTHTAPYKGLGSYGKKVAKSSSNMLKNLVERIC